MLFEPTPQAVIAGRYMRVPIASFPTYEEALAFVAGDAIGGPLVADAQIRRRADGFRVVVRTLTSAARGEA